MESPLNISQFHALLHSKKDQTKLMSALYAVTNISDMDAFIAALNPLSHWNGWI